MKEEKGPKFMSIKSKVVEILVSAFPQPGGHHKRPASLVPTFGPICLLLLCCPMSLVHHGDKS